MNALMLMFLFPLGLCAQNNTAPKKKSNGYGYLAIGGSFSKNGGDHILPSCGMGFRSKMASIGAAFYYHPNVHLSVHGDVKAFLSKNEKSAPFLCLQPGLLLYKRSAKIGNVTVTQKGGFAFNAIFGLMTSPNGKLPGVYFAAGYRVYSISTSSSSIQTTTSYPGGLISVGIRI